MAARWCWSIVCLLVCVPAFPAVEEIEFSSHGVTLSGSLVLPVDQSVRAAVVFVHGSGKQTRNLELGGRFAAAGIAALVYDKYEGQQSGSEKNISLLAGDAAAVDWVRRLAR